MDHIINPIRNEQGSVIVVALVVLVLLTLMGISVTTTSDIDIQIAKNEQDYVKEFLVADSAWRQGIEWLDDLSARPALKNPSLYTSGATGTDFLNVRNYGNGNNGQLNNNFQPGTQDGSLNVGSTQINYWYKIRYLDAQAMTGTPASSLSGQERIQMTGYTRHDFVITASTGTQNPAVTVTVFKYFPDESSY
jgi:Tfp pilus assembly protein PilX